MSTACGLRPRPREALPSLTCLAAAFPGFWDRPSGLLGEVTQLFVLSDAVVNGLFSEFPFQVVTLV